MSRTRRRITLTRQCRQRADQEHPGPARSRPRPADPDSPPGPGTTVEITLPHADPTIDSPRPVTAPPGELADGGSDDDIAGIVAAGVDDLFAASDSRRIGPSSVRVAVCRSVRPPAA